MKNHEFFEVLDLDKLKISASEWAKDFPYIEKVELLGPPNHVRWRDDQTGSFKWEYRFVVVVTVPPLNKTTEKYYNTIGDSPVTWRYRVDLLDFYKDKKHQNINDWRWISILPQKDLTNDQQKEDQEGVINSSADQDGSLTLYDAAGDKSDLIKEYTKIAISFCKNITEKKSQPPEQAKIKKHLETILSMNRDCLGKQKRSILPETVFRLILKKIPDRYKREIGKATKKTTA